MFLSQKMFGASECVRAFALISIIGVTTYAMLSLNTKLQPAMLVGVAALFFLIFAKPSATHVGLAVALYMFAHTHASRDIPSVAEFARLIALLIIIAAVSRGRLKIPHESFEFGAIASFGSIAYVVAIFAHGLSTDAATHFFSFALTCFALILAYRHLPFGFIRKGLEMAIFFALAASLIAAVVMPGTAIQGGRVEGIFANANTLGFFAALGILLVIVLERTAFRVLLMAVSVAALVATGSRSPLMAIAVAMAITSLAVVLRGQRGAARLLMLTAIGCVAGYFLMYSHFFTDLTLLRTNDSRAGGTEYALGIFSSDPWRGVGFGMSQIEIASTPLRWMAETGIIGFGCVIASYAVVLIIAWRHSWQAFMVAAFGVVHSLFEGWYFAGGSGLFLAFWLVYFCAVRSSADSDSGSVSKPPTHSGVRRTG